MITDGVLANQTNFNNAFVSKTSDSSMEGVLSLSNDATGADVSNVQEEINTSIAHQANTSNPHSVSKADVGLSDVTNDAQLKRSANDFSTFTEKITPVDDDIVLIEDSADSGNKKKLKLANMIGTGGGTSEFNYVSDSIDDWTAPFAEMQIEEDLTGKIREDYSMKISKDAGDYQGLYVRSKDIDFKDIDKSSILQIVFDGNLTDPNYVDGDYEIVFYDKDNSVDFWTSPIMSGLGKQIWKLQTPASYSFQPDLRIRIASSNTSAMDVYIADFSFREQEPIVTGNAGWKQYDLTVTGTNWTTSKAVGVPYKTLDGSWRMSFNVSGTLSSGVSAISISIDGVLFESTTTQAISCITSLSDAGIGYTNNGAAQIVGNSADGSAQTVYKFSGDVLLDAKPTFAQDFSNVVLSETTQNRKILVAGKGTAVESVDINTNLNFTEQTDSIGAWNGREFEATEDMEIYAGGSTSFTTNSDREIYAYVDSGSGYSVRQLLGGSNDALTSKTTFGGIIILNKGEKLAFRMVSASATTVNSTIDFYLNIIKLNTGSQTIAPTESIYVDGAGNAGETITADVTDIPFIKIDDSHGAWDGSQFTPPVSGRYSLKGMVRMTSAFSPGLYIQKGTTKKYIGIGVGSVLASFVGEIYLEKDKVISLRTDTGFTLLNDSEAHSISITRLK